MRKFTAKIIFDLVMTIIWIILMVYALTGSYWHEVLGLLIIGLFLVHIGYNIPTIIRLSRNRMRPRQAYYRNRRFRRVKSSYSNQTFRRIMNVTLLVLSLFTGISGILISTEILTTISVSNRSLWVVMHHWAAYLTMIVIAIHIGLHLKMIGAVLSAPFRRYPGIRRGLGRLWNGVALAMILYGAVASYHYELPSFSEALTEDKEQDSQYMSSLENTTSTRAIASTVSFETTSSESLEDYLGNLHCSFCHRNCPLSSPQCGRGEQLAQQYISQYNGNQESGNSDGSITNNNSNDRFSNNDGSISPNHTFGSSDSEYDNEDSFGNREFINNRNNSENNSEPGMPDENRNNIPDNSENNTDSIDPYSNSDNGSDSLENDTSSNDSENSAASIDPYSNSHNNSNDPENHTDTNDEPDINPDFNNPENNTDADGQNNNADRNNPNGIDIASIMGMYIGGTYYVTWIYEKQKRKRKPKKRMIR